jgi:hypothetical protein
MQIAWVEAALLDIAVIKHALQRMTLASRINKFSACCVPLPAW